MNECRALKHYTAVQLKRIPFGIEIAQLEQLPQIYAETPAELSIQDRLAGFLKHQLHYLFPLTTHLTIDHWHIAPQATAGPEAPPPGVIMVEVCVTLHRELAAEVPSNAETH